MKKVFFSITLALALFFAASFALNASTTTVQLQQTSKKGCVADLNGDGVTNTSDLLIFLGCYGCTNLQNCPGCQDADFDGDHDIDDDDLHIIWYEINYGC